MTSSGKSAIAVSGAWLERPVYLLCKNIAFADNLALDLRRHGLRARSFVNPQVLCNAGRNEAPLAVVADIAFAGAGANLQAACKQQGHGPTLLFLGADDDFGQRLRAVRAGGAGYYPIPVNRSALLHQLTALGMSAGAEPAERILIVDGPQEALADAGRTLDQAGFRTTTSVDPDRTLHDLEHGEFPLLLLNDDLDGMRGAELLRVVRQTIRFQALPVVMLTRGDTRRLEEEAGAAGTDALLRLPAAAADLLGVVRATLQRARQLSATYSYSIRRDPGSGLFNPGHFMDALRQAAAAAGQGGAALLWVNAGGSGTSLQSVRTDALLVHVADVVVPLLPPLTLAARMDVDAIAVLLPDLGSSELERLLHRLREQLRERLPDRCTLGATLLTSRQGNAVDALELARQAAARPIEAAGAADAGNSEAIDGWASKVQQALKENRFRLLYQPIASLSGQPTSFYEVFIRMIADSDGEPDVLPQEFLGSAEAGAWGSRSTAGYWRARCICFELKGDGGTRRPCSSSCCRTASPQGRRWCVGSATSCGRRRSSRPTWCCRSGSNAPPSGRRKPGAWPMPPASSAAGWRTSISPRPARPGNSCCKPSDPVSCTCRRTSRRTSAPTATISGWWR